MTCLPVNKGASFGRARSTDAHARKCGCSTKCTIYSTLLFCLTTSATFRLFLSPLPLPLFVFSTPQWVRIRTNTHARTRDSQTRENIHKYFPDLVHVCSTAIFRSNPKPCALTLLFLHETLRSAQWDEECTPFWR